MQKSLNDMQKLLNDMKFKVVKEINDMVKPPVTVTKLVASTKHGEHQKKKSNKIWKRSFKPKPVKCTSKDITGDIVPNTNWQAYLKSQKSITKKTFRPLNYNNKLNAKKENEKQNIKPEIWFDNVHPSLIKTTENIKETKLPVKQNGVCEKISENITRYIALDCEMVGVGVAGQESVLARVSLVNSFGDCIYDKFVKTIEPVVDYRTEFSGVRAENLKNAPDFVTAQKDVAELLKGRILVGHALKNDLQVLMLGHPRKHIRDTSKYKPFKLLLKTKRPALKKLAAVILNETIQDGEHNSVIDARVTMKIFQKHKKEWEKSHHKKKFQRNVVESKDIFMSKDDFSKNKKANKWSKRKHLKKKILEV